MTNSLDEVSSSEIRTDIVTNSPDEASSSEIRTDIVTNSLDEGSPSEFRTVGIQGRQRVFVAPPAVDMSRLWTTGAVDHRRWTTEAVDHISTAATTR